MNAKVIMGELLKDRHASVLLAGRYPGLVEGIRGLLASRFAGIFIVTDEAALAAFSCLLR